MRYIAKQTDNTYHVFIKDDQYSVIFGSELETTLSELKEMWEDAKILKEAEERVPIFRDKGGFDLTYVKRLDAYFALKLSPRKFTIDQVKLVAYETLTGLFDKSNNIDNYLTKLPPNGIEVEIEGNKIVKVYV